MAASRLALVLTMVLAAAPAGADEVAALYRVSWAGMAAGELRLTLRNDAAAYRDEIAIRSEGLPYLMTHFRATAVGEGRIADARLAPSRYDALYDLRKRKDRRISMQFIARAGAVIVDRGAADSSTKRPLAEEFRRDVVDPLSALEAIRDELRRGNRGGFTLRVYDGARRFDVAVRVLPQRARGTALHLELALIPIAGFKGETSEDGDPDTAKRVVTLAVSDDSQFLPLSMSVPLFYLPLVVELAHPCEAASCPW